MPRCSTCGDSMTLRDKRIHFKALLFQKKKNVQRFLPLLEICTILLSPNYFPLLVPGFLLNGQRGRMECKPQQLLSCPLAAQSHTVGREQQPALGLAGKSASITGCMSPAPDQSGILMQRTRERRGSPSNFLCRGIKFCKSKRREAKLFFLSVFKRKAEPRQIYRDWKC